MNAEGTHVRALTSGCTHARHCLGDDYPVYSPDGRRIVFQRLYGPIVRHTFLRRLLVIEGSAAGWVG